MLLYYILVPLAWLVWHLVFRIQVIGRDNLKKVATPGSIIAPTHVSAIDPVFIIISRFWGKRMIVFGKKELFEINPLLTWFFRCMGGVCVRGTREREGKILPPKSGMFVVAAQAGVDVVPCRIFYDTPNGRAKLFCRVRVVYGEPMPAAQFAMQDKRDVKAMRAGKKALTEAWEQLGEPYAFAPKDA